VHNPGILHASHQIPDFGPGYAITFLVKELATTFLFIQTRPVLNTFDMSKALPQGSEPSRLATAPTRQLSFTVGY
jgi:hypothetical protein